jgi:hypothetical protein
MEKLCRRNHLANSKTVLKMSIELYKFRGNNGRKKDLS